MLSTRSYMDLVIRPKKSSLFVDVEEVGCREILLETLSAAPKGPLSSIYATFVFVTTSISCQSMQNLRMSLKKLETYCDLSILKREDENLRPP